jgi:hypothetical protein
LAKSVVMTYINSLMSPSSLAKCIVFFSLFFNLKAEAQVLDWSNTQKLRGNSIYTSIIGEDESGIFVFRHRNKMLSKFVVMERYRHNLGLENSKSFLLKNTRILFADLNEGGLMILRQVLDKKNGSYSIIANSLNGSFESVIPETSLMQVKSTEWGKEPEIIVKASPDHTSYLIFNYEISGSRSLHFNYLIIDKSFKIIKKGDFQLKLNFNIEALKELIFDSNLEYTFLLTPRKSKKETVQFALVEANGDSNVTKTYNDTALALENPILFYNAVKDKKGLTGYYSSNYDNGYEGDFNIEWKQLLKDSLTIKLHPFTSTILKELRGESASHTGFIPFTYQALRVISRTDGGFLKISENAFIQKDQDIIMANGVPSTQGRNIYNYENVLIRNYDSTGSLAWESWISKNQTTVNDGGVLGSVFISTTENAVNIIFNDPITISGDIVLATFTPSGKREIKVIAKGDEMSAFIIPSEGKQISMDKVMVPVLKDRKFALLKVTFK